VIRGGAARVSLVAAVLIAATVVPILSWSQEDDGSRAKRREDVKQCRLYLKEALEKMEQADNDSAMIYLDLAIECDPKNPDVFYHKARIFLSQADTTRAVDTLADGVRVAPLSSRLKILLGRVELARGNMDRTSELMKEILAIKPREGEALYVQGLVQLAGGDTTGAMDSWRRSLEASMIGRPE